MQKVIPISDHHPDVGSRFQGEPMQTIARAALAKMLQMANRPDNAETIAKTRWPFDQDVQLLLRAASPPRDMTNTAALVAISYAILPMLAPYSAAARMFQAALSVSFGPEGTIMIPGLSTANVGFVGDGIAKPVVQPTSTAARLDPHKLAGIAVATDEMLASSAAELLIKTMLAESAGPALDAVVFSNAAASANAPAGLLLGKTPITASTATDFFDALVADVSAAAVAIAPVSGAGGLALIMNPAQFVGSMLRTWRNPENEMLMLPSAAVPAGTIIAIALNGIVSAIAPPEFEMGTQATLSMNDTPTAWPTGPVMSMFQTASTAIKMVTKMSWAVRNPLAVSVVGSTKW